MWGWGWRIINCVTSLKPFPLIFMGQIFAEKCNSSDTIVLLMYKSQRTLLTIELQVLVYFDGRTTKGAVCEKFWKWQWNTRESLQDSRLCTFCQVEFVLILYLHSFCFNQNCLEILYRNSVWFPKANSNNMQNHTESSGFCFQHLTLYFFVFLSVFAEWGVSYWSRSEVQSIVVV